MKARKKKEKLKRQFLEENYASYKELCDYDVFALIKQLASLCDSNPATQIAARLQARKMPKILRLDHTNLRAAEAVIAEFKQKYHHAFQDWQLMLIQTPHQSYSGEDDPILVVNEQGAIKPIGHFSLMLSAIADKFEHVAFLSIDKMIADDKRVLTLIERLQS